MVFAGCLKSQEGGAEQLKNHKNIHVVQMDITSDDEVTAALDYVSGNLPPKGETIVPRFEIFTSMMIHIVVFFVKTRCNLVGG